MKSTASPDPLSSPGEREHGGCDVIALLECPLTKQPLDWASDAVLSRLESLREQRRLLDRSGAPVTAELRSGLVNRAGTVFYPVSNGLPVLLRERAVALT